MITDDVIPSKEAIEEEVKTLCGALAESQSGKTPANAIKSMEKLIEMGDNLSTPPTNSPGHQAEKSIPQATEKVMTPTEKSKAVTPTEKNAAQFFEFADNLDAVQVEGLRHMLSLFTDKRTDVLSLLLDHLPTVEFEGRKDVVTLFSLIIKLGSCLSNNQQKSDNAVPPANTASSDALTPFQKYLVFLCLLFSENVWQIGTKKERCWK